MMTAKIAFIVESTLKIPVFPKLVPLREAQLMIGLHQLQAHGAIAVDNRFIQRFRAFSPLMNAHIAVIGRLGMESKPLCQETELLGQREIEIQSIVGTRVVALTIVDVQAILQVTDGKLIRIHADTFPVNQPRTTERYCRIQVAKDEIGRL